MNKKSLQKSEIIEIYKKVLKYPSIVGELSNYELDEVNSFASDLIEEATKEAVLIMEAKPDYELPNEYAENPFSFWLTRFAKYNDSIKVKSAIETFQDRLKKMSRIDADRFLLKEEMIEFYKQVIETKQEAIRHYEIKEKYRKTKKSEIDFHLEKPQILILYNSLKDWFIQCSEQTFLNFIEGTQPKEGEYIELVYRNEKNKQPGKQALLDLFYKLRETEAEIIEIPSDKALFRYINRWFQVNGKAIKVNHEHKSKPDRKPHSVLYNDTFEKIINRL